jgi:hypothetical protein
MGTFLKFKLPFGARRFDLNRLSVRHEAHALPSTQIGQAGNRHDLVEVD